MKTCSSHGLLHSHSARHITGHGLEMKGCPVLIQQNMFRVFYEMGDFLFNTRGFQLPISICASQIGFIFRWFSSLYQMVLKLDDGTPSGKTDISWLEHPHVQ